MFILLLLFPLLSADSCSIDGEAKYCTPEIMDMSRGESVSTKVSSNCENKEVCYDMNDKNGKECFQCNSTVEHLTDLEPRLRTCWISDTLPKVGSRQVQLHFSFGKTVEVIYIKINFCHKARPDSMIIKKSVDGKRWVPFQYYSSDCQKNYQVEEGGKVTRDNEVQALCHRILPNEDSISFSPLKFRPSSQLSDESPSLNDWITVSNLQIDLDNPKIGFNHYLLSDIKIVGRCKCNGHASRCIQDKTGRLRCDCKHNTAGRDCEKCKTGYHDRPWARGTRDNPNACVACYCNQHSNQCRFNPKLYTLSNQESGGYCTNCQHNTIGSRCAVCKEGFYRNPRRKIFHRDACIACDCHPTGSLSKRCDEMTGQCVCKKNTVGRNCNMCAEGYEQSNSLKQPCLRKRNVEKCKKCRRDSRKLTREKYCKNDYALFVEVQDSYKLRQGNQIWMCHKIYVHMRYKTPSLFSTVEKDDTTNVCIRLKKNSCICPKLKKGKPYFILAKQMRSKRRRRNERWKTTVRSSLRLDRSSVVMKWRGTYKMERKIEKFQHLNRIGMC